MKTDYLITSAMGLVIHRVDPIGPGVVRASPDSPPVPAPSPSPSPSPPPPPPTGPGF